MRRHEMRTKSFEDLIKLVVLIPFARRRARSQFVMYVDFLKTDLVFHGATSNAIIRRLLFALVCSSGL